MQRYLATKLLLTIPLVMAVAIMIFVLLELAPGSPIDQYVDRHTTPETRALLMERFQLDQSPAVRLTTLLRNLFTLELGVSLDRQRPVLTLIAEALPYSLMLGVTTLATLFPAGMLLGLLQAVRHRTTLDTGSSVVSLFFYSMPTFWLAMVLQLTLAYHLDLFPLDNTQSIMARFWSAPWRVLDTLWHLVLPGIALGLAEMAGVARYMRGSLLDALQADYVRTARAKGVPERWVIGHHALRNSLLPLITLLGLSLPSLFTGAVLVETVFSWPGMGTLIYEAILVQDTPVIVGCFFVITLLVVAGNVLADVLYSVIDPRIRIQ